jgi:hypothetical protein
MWACHMIIIFFRDFGNGFFLNRVESRSLLPEVGRVVRGRVYTVINLKFKNSFPTYMGQIR